MKSPTSRAVWAIVAVLLAGERPVVAADAAVQQAVADLQHGNFTGAEQKLRLELKLHPADAETLSLLGIALDQQKRFAEAAEFHKRAVAAAPNSTAVLYNYANNRLAVGDEKTARDLLLKSLAVDPSDHASNLAMAQLAVNRGDGAEALKYLDPLKDSSDSAILHLTALDLSSKLPEADKLFQQLSGATQENGPLSSAYGMALAKAGQYGQAETFLTHALAKDPANFDILYTLGVAASREGHNDKAKGVLETALRQQPKNVDVLYALALTYNASGQSEQAIRLLAQAADIDPKRADVQKLVAITAANMKADEDSVAAWTRYLKLVPNDDDARRELAFEKARSSLLQEALPELRKWVASHPDNATGYYELGLSESVDDPAKGIATLNRAIELNPNLATAHAARGFLLFTQNNPEAAVKDLEFAASHLPAVQTPTVLDRLGQSYLAMDRPADAVPWLRKAAQLAPADPTIELHLANALAEKGDTAESESLMQHFRQMRPGTRTPRIQGVVDYLSMSPEQQHDLYRTRLEKAVHDHPDDVTANLLYLKFLLSNRETDAALKLASRLPAMQPGAVALADAGHALLAASQYNEAKMLLGKAAESDASGGVTLDLAIATFHAAGAGRDAAAEGLKQLDRVPESARRGDFYSARAQMLDVSGKPDESIAAIQHGIAAEPGRPELYWQAAVLMQANHRTGQIDKLLESAAQALPQEWQIPVIRSAFLELAGQTAEADQILADARHRWPEAAGVWIAHGLILAAHGDAEAGLRALETGVALGAHNPETFRAVAALKKDQKPAEQADPARLFLSSPPGDW